MTKVFAHNYFRTIRVRHSQGTVRQKRLLYIPCLMGNFVNLPKQCLINQTVLYEKTTYLIMAVDLLGMLSLGTIHDQLQGNNARAVACGDESDTQVCVREP